MVFSKAPLMTTTIVKLLKNKTNQTPHHSGRLKIRKYLETSIETQPHHSQSNAKPNKNKPKTQPLPSSYRAPNQGNSAQLPCHTLSCSPTPFGLQSFPAHTCGRCSLPQAAGALLSTKHGRNHANYPLLWHALPWWRRATRSVQQSLSEGL